MGSAKTAVSYAAVCGKQCVSGSMVNNSGGYVGSRPVCSCDEGDHLLVVWAGNAGRRVSG